MYGKDVDRMISLVDQLKDAAYDALINVANANNYQLKTTSIQGNCGDGNCAICKCKSNEDPVSIGNPMGSVMSIYSSLSNDFNKMNEMANSHFHSASGFNNSIGSPWKELSKLQSVVNNANNYASGNSPLNWVSQKSSMLAHLNSIIQFAVDTKYALTIYHDYIQRGYDTKYNNNNPSIDFDYTMNQKHNGNMLDDYNENVQIEKENLNPF